MTNIPGTADAATSDTGAEPSPAAAHEAVPAPGGDTPARIGRGVKIGVGAAIGSAAIAAALLYVNHGRSAEALDIATGDADAALAVTFARILAATLADDPELATGLGLDTGDNAALRARLSDGSAAARDARLARTRAFVTELGSHDGAGLGSRAALDREVVRHALVARTVAPARFGIDMLTRPYRLSQQSGAYYWLPDFLAATHPVTDSDDAEAYLIRLAGFARALNEHSAEQRQQAARGMLAPGFALDLTLGQLARLRDGGAAANGLVGALAAARPALEPRAHRRLHDGDRRAAAIARRARDRTLCEAAGAGGARPAFRSRALSCHPERGRDAAVAAGAAGGGLDPARASGVSGGSGRAPPRSRARGERCIGGRKPA